MTRHGSFWDLKPGFHGLFEKTVKALRFVCREPAAERKTPDDKDRDSGKSNVLSAEDERRTADNFAYFAAKAKGGDFVTAVMLQENHNLACGYVSMDVLLSGNKSPAAATIVMLQRLLFIMTEFSRGSMLGPLSLFLFCFCRYVSA